MKHCASRIRIAVTLLALVGLLVPLDAAAQAGTGNVEVRFEETNSTQFPTVSARVTVLDPQGLPISGLDAAAFTVFEDGKSVQVSKVEPYVNQQVRIAVALPIDISGTMYEEISEAKAQARTFVDGLGPNDLVAVLGFKDKVNLDEPFPVIDATREIGFTTDRTAVRNLIDSLSVPDPNKGDTPLYDALFKAVRMTAQVTGVDYRFVMPFTDGRQDCLKKPKDCIMGLDDPITEARDKGIPVFAIGLGDKADEAYLKKVALMTGATYHYAPTPDTLAQIYNQVTDRLKQQYVITYQAKAPADARDHRLEVKVRTGLGEGANVTVIRYPCPQKPGVRLFYEKPSDVPGQPATLEPLEDNFLVQAIKVVPDISACNPIARAELYLDDRLVFEATNKPFHLLYDLFRDSAPPADGTHRFRVRVYDTLGNASDDVVVAFSLVVPQTGVTVSPPPPGVTVSPATVIGGAVTPPPTVVVKPEGTIIPGFPNWGLAVAGLALILLVLIVILLATRRRWKPCPVCGQRMDPSWHECRFCAAAQITQSEAYVAVGTEEATGRGAPPGAYVEDHTIPEAPAFRGDQGDLYGSAAQAEAYAAPASPPTEVIRKVPKLLGWLIVEQGDRPGHRFGLHEGDTTIGRAGTSEIVLGDAAVGRQQAKIRLEADGFYLYDLAATNPTLVNGQPATRHPLQPDDRVQVGNTVLVYKHVQT